MSILGSILLFYLVAQIVTRLNSVSTEMTSLPKVPIQTSTHSFTYFSYRQ